MARIRFQLAITCVCAGLVLFLAIPNVCGQMTSQAQSSLPSAQSGSGGGNPPSQSTGALSAVPEGFATIKVKPGFLLDVQFYNEQELDTRVRVDSTGSIMLPLIGELHVNALSTTQLERLIENTYRSKGMLNYPQVNVNILQYAGGFVTVGGEVNHAGKFPMIGDHSLSDVLAYAGGETPYASSIIEISRTGDNGPKKEIIRYARDSSPARIAEVMIHSGDTVTVHRAGVVYVLGSVNRPGGYVMQEDGELTANQALALAMGVAYNAKQHSAWIIRKQPNGSEVVIRYDYLKAAEGKRPEFAMQPQDILYVAPSGIKSFLSQSNVVLSAVASASIYRIP